MGNCIKGEPGAVNKNRQIDRDLKSSRKKLSKEIKLLLLGAGESGKSTIFRQLRIIHHNGFNDEEREMFREVIYGNVILNMKALISATIKYDTPIASSDNRERAQKLSSVDNENMTSMAALFPELATEIAELWHDDAIQSAWAKRSDFQIYDTADYFFNDIPRLVAKDYIPSEADILRSRLKTTGIAETYFEVKNFKFKLYDVGGQRNERKKWIHCFQGVTAIIFVASLSEFDQRCYEDDKTNRMKESLNLFEETVNSKWFSDTAMILFLNKEDLFKRKVEMGIDPSVSFPEYTDGCDAQKAAKFLENLYKSKCRVKNKQIYTHFTCATDTGNIRTVFDFVRDILLHQNLEDNGLI